MAKKEKEEPKAPVAKSSADFVVVTVKPSSVVETATIRSTNSEAERVEFTLTAKAGTFKVGDGFTLTKV